MEHTKQSRSLESVRFIFIFFEGKEVQNYYALQGII